MPRSENPKRPFFDYQQIEHFGKCSLPVEDIAHILNMPLERINRMMARENSKFYRSYRRGQAMTKLGILQRQISVATGEAQGNAPLLQHLGAILLGQNASKKPTENIQDTAEKLMQDVSETQKAEMFATLIETQAEKEEIIDE